VATKKTKKPAVDAPMDKRELPPIASKWVRYLLGFSVSAAVGLAPYLGRVHVPLFTPMLTMIPLSLQDTAIPTASACMGLVAVLVQWGRSRRPKDWEIGTALVASLFSLLIFVGLEMTTVAHIDVPAVNGKVSFAVGLSTPNKPPCIGLGRDECIAKKLNLDESYIDSFFGDTQTSLAKLWLVLSYVGFMTCFGLVVGLLVLRDSNN
jgi:hypothetical protein